MLKSSVRKKDLAADLRELVGALDPDKCIEGKVLVDLCRQRSERRGSGCDVSRPCEDLPDPSTSTSRMVHRPAVQVNLGLIMQIQTNILTGKGGSS